MTHSEAAEVSRQHAQLRRIERDNEEFRRVLFAIEQAKNWISDEGPNPYLVGELNKAATLIQKRILHVVYAKEARELATDGPLK